MKVFHCDHCEHLVFFENTRCLGCDHTLAYLPDQQIMGALVEHPGGRWRSPREGREELYRLCANYESEGVCNWAVHADDPNPLCLSCRTTRVIPDLGRPGHKDAWYRLEVAKRRLIENLLSLGLSLEDESSHGGLSFEFLADSDAPDAPPVLTGHAQGVITVNVAEADDAEREHRRHDLHEPYRTLLGHFRHESGHYYWDHLLKDGPRLEGFRQLFGDDRRDYGAALKSHHAGPASDWQEHFISAYASAHPWEDWAETWAHYLHVTDALEMAGACGVSLRPRRADEPALETRASGRTVSFERMIEDWFPLTYLLNSLNRGLGLPDAYPFVLSPAIVEKLRFVHETIVDERARHGSRRAMVVATVS
jgi:hypothetical protein